jgi:hypothetical protein
MAYDPQGLAALRTRMSLALGELRTVRDLCSDELAAEARRVIVAAIQTLANLWMPIVDSVLQSDPLEPLSKPNGGGGSHGSARGLGSGSPLSEATGRPTSIMLSSVDLAAYYATKSWGRGDVPNSLCPSGSSDPRVDPCETPRVQQIIQPGDWSFKNALQYDKKLVMKTAKKCRLSEGCSFFSFTLLGTARSIRPQNGDPRLAAGTDVISGALGFVPVAGEVLDSAQIVQGLRGLSAGGSTPQAPTTFDVDVQIVVRTYGLSGEVLSSSIVETTATYYNLISTQQQTIESAIDHQDPPWEWYAPPIGLSNAYPNMIDQYSYGFIAQTTPAAGIGSQERVET